MPKLMIVDDEEDIREFATRFFLKRGVDVSTADSGDTAIALIEKVMPDLVLLDITMDGKSGLDVLKDLRSKGNNVKVIMVTGIEDEATVNEANSWGVKGYIHKPLILEELEKIVMAELS